MNVSEAEAKTKWCPYTNRKHAETCLASKCMVWEPLPTAGLTFDYPDAPVTTLKDAMDVRAWTFIEDALRDRDNPALNSIAFFDRLSDADLLMVPNFGRITLRRYRQTFADYKARFISHEGDERRLGRCGLTGPRP